MAPQSRGRPGSFVQAAPLPSLASLQHNHAAPAIPREEQTARAVNGIDHPLGSSSADGDEDEEDEDEEEDDADFQSHYSLDARSSSGSSDADSDHVDTAQEQLPFLHHSNSSFLIANAFAPPFYNRPPTPLPPSPSLTSLLRPSFSTTTSRPTTPDDSDNDTPNDTEAAVAKSARTATTLPRASPKVPTYEYYGFVLYLLSSLAFLIYLLWSYLPSPFLHQLGIHYYPNRWWSLAIPSFLVMTLVYIYVALASYNTGYLTLPLRSIDNIVDEAANIAVLDSKGIIKGKNNKDAGIVDIHEAKSLEWTTLWSEGTDAVMDVPIGGVCEILYGEG